MNRTLASIVAAVALLIPLSVGSASAEESEQTDASMPATLLYVFEGRDVVVKPIAGQQGAFSFTMPITKSNKRVTWFTDRPNRDAGRMSMDALVNLWQKDEEDSFLNDPPNAAITVGERVVVATMTNPRITTNKKGDQSLVATMTLVNADRLAELASGDSFVALQAQQAGSNARPGSKTLPLVSVFVDTTTCQVQKGWLNTYVCTCDSCY